MEYLDDSELGRALREALMATDRETCRHCGQEFLMADLGAVLYHHHVPHQPREDVVYDGAMRLVTRDEVEALVRDAQAWRRGLPGS